MHGVRLVEAARKKFTPEFINRLDAMVVFHALGETGLRQVTEIELRRVQQRVLTSKAVPFVFHLTEAALDQLLVRVRIRDMEPGTCDAPLTGCSSNQCRICWLASNFGPAIAS